MESGQPTQNDLDPPALSPSISQQDGGRLMRELLESETLEDETNNEGRCLTNLLESCTASCALSSSVDHEATETGQADGNEQNDTGKNYPYSNTNSQMSLDKHPSDQNPLLSWSRKEKGDSLYGGDRNPNPFIPAITQNQTINNIYRESIQEMTKFLGSHQKTSYPSLERTAVSPLLNPLGTRESLYNLVMGLNQQAAAKHIVQVRPPSNKCNTHEKSAPKSTRTIIYRQFDGINKFSTFRLISQNIRNHLAQENMDVWNCKNPSLKKLPTTIETVNSFSRTYTIPIFTLLALSPSKEPRRLFAKVRRVFKHKSIKLKYAPFASLCSMLSKITIGEKPNYQNDVLLYIVLRTYFSLINYKHLSTYKRVTLMLDLLELFETTVKHELGFSVAFGEKEGSIKEVNEFLKENKSKFFKRRLITVSDSSSTRTRRIQLLESNDSFYSFTLEYNHKLTSTYNSVCKSRAKQLPLCEYYMRKIEMMKLLINTQELYVISAPPSYSILDEFIEYKHPDNIPMTIITPEEVNIEVEFQQIKRKRRNFIFDIPLAKTRGRKPNALLDSPMMKKRGASARKSKKKDDDDDNDDDSGLSDSQYDDEYDEDMSLREEDNIRRQDGSEGKKTKGKEKDLEKIAARNKKLYEESFPVIEELTLSDHSYLFPLHDCLDEVNSINRTQRSLLLDKIQIDLKQLSELGHAISMDDEMQKRLEDLFMITSDNDECTIIFDSNEYLSTCQLINELGDKLLSTPSNDTTNNIIIRLVKYFQKLTLPSRRQLFDIFKDEYPNTKEANTQVCMPVRMRLFDLMSLSTLMYDSERYEWPSSVDVDPDYIVPYFTLLPKEPFIVRDATPYDESYHHLETEDDPDYPPCNFNHKFYTNGAINRTYTVLSNVEICNQETEKERRDGSDGDSEEEEEEEEVQDQDKDDNSKDQEKASESKSSQRVWRQYTTVKHTNYFIERYRKYLGDEIQYSMFQTDAFYERRYSLVEDNMLINDLWLARNEYTIGKLEEWLLCNFPSVYNLIESYDDVSDEIPPFETVYTELMDYEDDGSKPSQRRISFRSILADTIMDDMVIHSHTPFHNLLGDEEFEQKEALDGFDFDMAINDKHNFKFDAVPLNSIMREHIVKTLNREYVVLLTNNPLVAVPITIMRLKKLELTYQDRYINQVATLFTDTLNIYEIQNPESKYIALEKKMFDGMEDGSHSFKFDDNDEIMSEDMFITQGQTQTTLEKTTTCLNVQDPHIGRLLTTQMYLNADYRNSKVFPPDPQRIKPSDIPIMFSASLRADEIPFLIHCGICDWVPEELDEILFGKTELSVIKKKMSYIWDVFNLLIYNNTYENFHIVLSEISHQLSRYSFANMENMNELSCDKLILPQAYQYVGDGVTSLHSSTNIMRMGAQVLHHLNKLNAEDMSVMSDVSEQFKNATKTLYHGLAEINTERILREESMEFPVVDREISLSNVERILPIDLEANGFHCFYKSVACNSDKTNDVAILPLMSKSSLDRTIRIMMAFDKLRSLTYESKYVHSIGCFIQNDEHPSIDAQMGHIKRLILYTDDDHSIFENNNRRAFPSKITSLTMIIDIFKILLQQGTDGCRPTVLIPSRLYVPVLIFRAIVMRIDEFFSCIPKTKPDRKVIDGILQSALIAYVSGKMKKALLKSVVSYMCPFKLYLVGNLKSAFHYLAEAVSMIDKIIFNKALSAEQIQFKYCSALLNAQRNTNCNIPIFSTGIPAALQKLLEYGENFLPYLVLESLCSKEGKLYLRTLILDRDIPTVIK